MNNITFGDSVNIAGRFVPPYSQNALALIYLRNSWNLSTKAQRGDH